MTVIQLDRQSILHNTQIKQITLAFGMNCIFVLNNLQIINETMEFIFETRLSIRHVSESLNYVDVFEQVLPQRAYQLNYFPRVMRAPLIPVIR